MILRIRPHRQTQARCVKRYCRRVIGWNPEKRGDGETGEWFRDVMHHVEAVIRDRRAQRLCGVPKHRLKREDMRLGKGCLGDGAQCLVPGSFKRDDAAPPELGERPL